VAAEVVDAEEEPTADITREAATIREADRARRSCTTPTPTSNTCTTLPPRIQVRKADYFQRDQHVFSLVSSGGGTPTVSIMQSFHPPGAGNAATNVPPPGRNFAPRYPYSLPPGAAGGGGQGAVGPRMPVQVQQAGQQGAGAGGMPPRPMHPQAMTPQTQMPLTTYTMHPPPGGIVIGQVRVGETRPLCSRKTRPHQKCVVRFAPLLRVAEKRGQEESAKLVVVLLLLHAHVMDGERVGGDDGVCDFPNAARARLLSYVRSPTAFIVFSTCCVQTVPWEQRVRARDWAGSRCSPDGRERAGSRCSPDGRDPRGESSRFASGEECCASHARWTKKVSSKDGQNERILMLRGQKARGS